MSEQTGRTVTAVDVPLQVFADQFRALGLPERVATGVTSFFATLGAGEYAHV